MSASTTTIAQPTSRNGVNVEQLVATVNAVQANPALARFQFRSHTDWQTGGRSVTRIAEFFGAGQEDTSRSEPFMLVGDEPPVLLGENQGPNAVEAVLHALASCLAVGFVYNAAARGITVRSLAFDVEGDLDLQGFLGLSETVRAGYSNVRVRYTVDCDATTQQVDELCAYVQRTSPVLDILRNPVQVNVSRI